jgi:hypothetical protein
MPPLSTPHCPPLASPVVAVGHAVDLALLTVSDESFWMEPTPMLPLAMGDVPTLQENVLVGRGGGVGWDGMGGMRGVTQAARGGAVPAMAWCGRVCTCVWRHCEFPLRNHD